MAENKSLLQTIKQNPLAWIVQGVGLLVLILNLWLASQLSPIQSDLRNITNKVKAVEVEQDRNQDNHEDIQVIKEQINNIREDVVEIKVDLKTLINRL